MPIQSICFRIFVDDSPSGVLKALSPIFSKASLMRLRIADAFDMMFGLSFILVS